MGQVLPPEACAVIKSILKERFHKNSVRHMGISWADVEAHLNERPEKLWSLQQMEDTRGEPDVVGQDTTTGEFIFFDCCPETPAGRRSLCYDREALDSRKDNKPYSSAVDMATTMGVDILTEEEYKALQKFGSFDTKTSSWIKTPFAIRNLGGAVFADRRYNHIFVYHNGASSYYATRGFRGCVKV